MTIADYAHNFDGYSGEASSVDPKVQERSGDKIVSTKMTAPGKAAIPFVYRMDRHQERLEDRRRLSERLCQRGCDPARRLRVHAQVRRRQALAQKLECRSTLTSCSAGAEASALGGAASDPRQGSPATPSRGSA